MTILHTVNKSPFETSSLRTCLAYAMGGATLLLIEDGVYAAMRGTAVEADLSGALERIAICALGPDLSARGLDGDAVVDGVRVVGYDDFVDLAVSHDKVQAWL